MGQVGRKVKFVVSDLHLGAGHAYKGGNLLEDFRADEVFVDFLHHIWHESERDNCEIELIINGDLFEFLQVPAVDNYDPTTPYPKEAYLDSSEAASIKRLNNIVEGHQRIFSAFSDFMHVEASRSITLIKGNHDVNLFWPGVKNRLREILGASGMRASLLRFANEFISREQIYVEHGHQHAERINSYTDSFDPCSPDDPDQLFYPIGSQFVINFLNRVEPGWWFVDHIKPIPMLIWFALHWDFDFACQALVSLAKFAPEIAGHTSTTRDRYMASIFTLLDDISNDEKRHTIAENYFCKPNFRLQMHRKIQYILDSINGYVTPSVHIGEDPREMGRAHQEQQHTLLRQAANLISYREKAKIVLFGHSHYPIQQKLSSGSTYINTGSWIEDFSDAPEETWAHLFGDLRQPSRPPAQLPYARIEYDEDDMPAARLLFFNSDAPINL